MNSNATPLERAFQLAKSGNCKSIAAIHAAMKKEGYSTDQVQGPALYKQLKACIEAAKK